MAHFVMTNWQPFAPMNQFLFAFIHFRLHFDYTSKLCDTISLSWFIYLFIQRYLLSSYLMCHCARQLIIYW